MPQALTIQAQVGPDGHLPQAHRRQIAATLRLYAERDVEITIRRPKRSSQANRYYWGVVIATVQRAMVEAGMLATQEAIHELFKRRYLPVRTVELMGEPVTLTGSTADLDSTEFYEYVEAIRMDEDVLALGCVIPEPDPHYRSYKIAEPA